jgi:hypothetical protein
MIELEQAPAAQKTVSNTIDNESNTIQYKLGD